jgi:hypothetical protein
MDQHLDARAPSVRFVLRLLVLAGAGVVWWLLLSGGPAQADDSDSAVVSSATVSRAVPSARASEGTSGLLPGPVAVATGHLRQAPTQAADTLAATTTSAPAPVRATVHAVVAPLEPAVVTTTAHVADVLDRTAAAVDGVVAPVLQAPGVEAPPAAAATSRASSRTVVRKVRDAGRHGWTDAGQITVAGATSASLAAGADAVAHVVKRLGDTPLPRLPHGSQLPVSATDGLAPLAGLLAGLALLLPVLLRRRLSFGGDALPAGPAYPPGSSPG